MTESQERPAPAAGPGAALRLITSRRFGPYFFGNALSASGGWFQNLAASLLIYRLTGSELLLGVLTFANFAPILLLAPWAGAAADRFDRRRLLLVTQPTAAALAALLALFTHFDLVTVPLVICLVLAMGVVTAFSTPAQQALITSLVPPAEIPSAVALNSMTFNIARTAGPAGAAAAVETLGIDAAFAINSASFLAFVVALLLIKPSREERAESFSLRDSLRLIRRRPRLLAFLLIVTAVGFASDPINTLAPAYAHEFGYADTAAGVVIGVFGAGAVTAAFLVAGRMGSGWRSVATLLLMAGGVSAFSLVGWFPLALGLLFLGGIGYLASNTAATSRLQLDVEPSQRGRIMALWSIAFLGLRPIASLIDGAIADAFGVRAAGVALSMPALAAAITLAVIIGRGRRAARVADARAAS